MRPIATALVVGLFWTGAAVGQTIETGLARLDFMIGAWRGTSSGRPGEGTVERVCAKVLNDRFVECRTTATYPPQEKSKNGEVHVERSLYSYDKAGNKLRLRQFHGESFVSTYVESGALAFETVEIENVPAGWRARETHEHPSAGVWLERFDLAGPGQDFALYAASRLQRITEERTYDPELAKRLGADERGMRMYVLCILKTGPKDADITGDERKAIFAGHFANIERLAEEGRLALAGPFGKNDKAFRGLYIFNVATIEEAETLVMLDPAVKAGVFVPELTSWYGSAAVTAVHETHKRIEKPKS
jgi:uncharacterized protein YciI